MKVVATHSTSDKRGTDESPLYSGLPHKADRLGLLSVIAKRNFATNLVECQDDAENARKARNLRAVRECKDVGEK